MKLYRDKDGHEIIVRDDVQEAAVKNFGYEYIQDVEETTKKK
jgi:hypothetical protein